MFEDDFLNGKVAFVAGGTSGINKTVAEQLGAFGAKIFIVSRSQDKVDAAINELAEQGITVDGASADVRSYEAIQAAIEACTSKWGLIDIVLSGAAGNFIAEAKDMSSNGFKTVVDIDLNGTFNVLRAAYPHLRKPGASIINISASQGFLPAIGQAHVCSAKSGVNMLTQTLALEWGSEGVRVNAVAPGPIGGTEGMDRLTPTTTLEQALLERIPLARYGTKQEVADLVLFLCSERAAYISGAVIPCDGGQSLTGNIIFRSGASVAQDAGEV